MDFRILGSLEATAGAAVADLGPPKQRALLTILLLHAGEIVPVDRLTESLWPEGPPRTAAHSIQIYVSELRKALAPLAAHDLIVTRHPGYELRADDEEIDARRFERLVDEGLRHLEAGDQAAGATALRAALALWRGPALSDFAYEEFAQPYIRRLTDRHLDAIEELAAADLEAGRLTDAISLVEAAIREDPLRERSREILMLALYRAGRHAEALRTYQRLRETLAEELGLDPSPPLQRLQERILLHDPSLAPARLETAATSAPERNPYKGLRPFTEEDAPDFFGREALVDRMLEALRAGARLVALVGPSGSGKSSAVAAGLIPRLRTGALPGSERWRITSALPGPGLLGALDAAPGGGERRLLVIDQFEDLFTATDEATRRRVLALLTVAATAPDPKLTVLLTLRADHYDRPLLDPGFARVFIPGVMNVLPMTTDELEAAIVKPAERAGVTVEPRLVADLVADSSAHPGALPLLQYALTELFDESEETSLTLARYRGLGGLRGILSRRAESVYGQLDDRERQVALQVFLRLVRPGHGTIDSRRRVALSDLTDLDVDPVALSSVLDVFGRQRLLSFDREPISGEATVEVAHEALLREWDRLAGWIDRHRAALRRHDTLRTAVEEWEASGRDPDYLPTGARLADLEATVEDGALQLTGRERAFLEASRDRREADQAREATRADAHRRLERRARTRLIALGVALVAVAVLGGFALAGATGGRRAGVALLYNGDGVFMVTRVVQQGYDSAVSELGLASKKVSVSDGPSADAALRALSASGVGMIVVGAVDTDVDAVAADFPRTHYVVIDLPATRPNVTHLAFATNQGSFLAGVAAASRSRTGTVGFIGGQDGPVIWPFEAGFEAGARAVDPSITVLSTYLALPGDYNGFVDPAAATSAADAQYRAGADVIFAAAGDSGLGVFKAATDRSRTSGRQLWAIGVDTDQYQTVSDDPANVDWRDWQTHILTSVVNRFDTGVFTVLTGYGRGDPVPGTLHMDLAVHGVDISYSGKFIDDLRPTIDAWRARIIGGEAVVPCYPADREAQARAMGLAEGACAG
jgi:basic membrane lipoprotein Med (substrate-binding protein (PBP1-ABC) superfamily)/DNA-binding SARP family transcriptional activator